MKKGKNVKAKRRLFIISLTMFTLMGVLVCRIYPEFIKIMDNKKQIIELTEKYDSLLEQESQLKSEVAKMQNPDYIARYAKEKYLYSDENEIIIRID